MRVAVVGVERVAHALQVQQVRARAADDLLEPVVEAHQAPLGRDVGDAARRAVEGVETLEVARAQLLDPVGDVAEVDGRPADVGVVGQVPEHDLEVAPPPVLVQHPEHHGAGRARDVGDREHGVDHRLDVVGVDEVDGDAARHLLRRPAQHVRDRGADVAQRPVGLVERDHVRRVVQRVARPVLLQLGRHLPVGLVGHDRQALRHAVLPRRRVSPRRPRRWPRRASRPSAAA